MHFKTECILALQGHPRSLIMAPNESMYAIFYWSYLAPFQRYCWYSAEKSDPTPIMGCSLVLDCQCSGSEERRAYANY